MPRTTKRSTHAEALRRFADLRDPQARAFQHSARVADWRRTAAADPFVARYLESLVLRDRDSAPHKSRERTLDDRGRLIDYLAETAVYLARPTVDPVMLELHRACANLRRSPRYIDREGPGEPRVIGPHPLFVLALADPRPIYTGLNAERRKPPPSKPPDPEAVAADLAKMRAWIEAYDRGETAPSPRDDSPIREEDGGWTRLDYRSVESDPSAPEVIALFGDRPPDRVTQGIDASRRLSYERGKGVAHLVPPSIPLRRPRFHRKAKRSVALWAVFRYCESAERGVIAPSEREHLERLAADSAEHDPDGRERAYWADLIEAASTERRPLPALVSINDLTRLPAFKGVPRYEANRAIERVDRFIDAPF